MEQITQNIAEIIEASEKTQNELAMMIGVNPKQVQRWKSGQAEMGIYKLREFCQFYGVSADYILGLPKGLKWLR